jgi:hypothetical protein
MNDIASLELNMFRDIASGNTKHTPEDFGFSSFDELSLVLDFAETLREGMESKGLYAGDTGAGFGARDMAFEYRGEIVDVNMKVRKEKEDVN